MPRSRDYLLPPILQVLENGCWQRQYSEGCSSVIVWLDPDLPKRTKKASKRPQTPLSDLLRTIDLRDRDDEQDQGAERFSHIVHFPDDDSIGHGQDGSDSSATFQVRSSANGLGSIKPTFTMLKMAIQKFIPPSGMDRILRTMMRNQEISN